MEKPMKTIVAALFAVLMVTGLSPSRADSPNAAAPVGQIAAAAPAISDHYVLGPPDKLHVTFYGEEALSGDFIIGSDGRLSLPLVGNVKAAGLTVGQLQDEISSAYKNGYVKDPKVTAEVISARPFFIMGEVKTPGQYPFVPGLTAINAVATAGGFTYRAKTDVVYIRHANEMDEGKVELTPTTRVLPGDTIRIGERWF